MVSDQYITYQKALTYVQWWTKTVLLTGFQFSCCWCGSAACGTAAELLFTPMYYRKPTLVCAQCVNL